MSKRKLDKNDDYYLTDDSRIELDVDKFAQSATMRAAIEKLELANAIQQALKKALLIEGYKNGVVKKANAKSLVLESGTRWTKKELRSL